MLGLENNFKRFKLSDELIPHYHIIFVHRKLIFSDALIVHILSLPNTKLKPKLKLKKSLLSSFLYPYCPCG